MTKKEIIKQNLCLQGVYFVHSLVKMAYLKAIDEYGRQCFEAGFKNGYKAAESNDGNENYDDYLKELEEKP